MRRRQVVVDSAKVSLIRYSSGLDSEQKQSGASRAAKDEVEGLAWVVE
jgi:hypothetical protein